LEETSSDRHQTVNKLRKNVINSLLLTLNNNLSEVRTNQADYLRHLDSRVSDINNFLLVSTSDYHDVDLIPDKTGEEMTIDQIQQIMENEHMTKEREKEVGSR
jgi:phosphopantetheine adenylyltransferase